MVLFYCYVANFMGIFEIDNFTCVGYLVYSTLPLDDGNKESDGCSRRYYLNSIREETDYREYRKWTKGQI